MTKDRKIAYLALLTTAVIWGLAPPVIKYTLKFLSPVSFLFYRFLIASILIALPLLLKLRRAKPNKKDLLLYLFLGFLAGPLNLLLLFWGIEKTTASDASLISIISPILIILGGAFFLKEKVTKTERIGIAVTVVGTILAIIQPFWENKAGAGTYLFGNSLVFLGTVIWVIFTLLAKKNRQLDPFILSSSSFVVGLIVLLPITYHLSPLTLPALPGLIFMSVFSSIVAYFAYTYGLSKIEASEATLFTYLQPLFAVPASVAFLHEKLTLPFLSGAILIIIGVFVCEQRGKLFSGGKTEKSNQEKSFS